MNFLSLKFLLVMSIILSSSIAAFSQTDREKGFALYAGGDLKAAIESLEKAVAADAKDNEAWRFLGMSYLHRKEGHEDIPLGVR